MNVSGISARHVANALPKVNRQTVCATRAGDTVHFSGKQTGGIRRDLKKGMCFLVALPFTLGWPVMKKVFGALDVISGISDDASSMGGPPSLFLSDSEEDD